uniref:Uncharacterized protein n=1 Tax=Utricularia reniformis TaxID=192314 RepID=A0A1Y0B1W7_9LAMI|nr:hypothetical protein AEK19_MT1233 [Utricularia reniformis]ART31445.1 hypothetical protein AEK19_MT1233 [Utricularia reniformis]
MSGRDITTPGFGQWDRIDGIEKRRLFFFWESNHKVMPYFCCVIDKYQFRIGGREDTIFIKQYRLAWCSVIDLASGNVSQALRLELIPLWIPFSRSHGISGRCILLVSGDICRLYLNLSIPGGNLLSLALKSLCFFSGYWLRFKPLYECSSSLVVLLDPPEI